jgi:hypothetical protein
VPTFTDGSLGLNADFSFHSHGSNLIAFLFNAVYRRDISSHGYSPLSEFKHLFISTRWFWRRIAGRVVTPQMVHTSLLTRIEKTVVVPAGKWEFYGDQFPGPVNCARYLAFWYGSNGAVPVRNYN